MKLVVGGGGFLGSCVANALYNTDHEVRILDKYGSLAIQDKRPQFEIISGDINHKETLVTALKNVDTVYYFISHSFPSMNDDSLKYEIDNTLKSIDFVLSVMNEQNVKKIVFPSSGGTLYGEVSKGLATESQQGEPTSTYGAGKLLSEDIIKYYCRVYGFRALILRLSNVYGCPFNRKVQQGAIDIFIQKALANQQIELWGDPSYLIRDHLFIDDFCSAVLSLVDLEFDGAEIFNVASGIGHSLDDVILCIEKTLGRSVDRVIRPNSFAGVRRNVLDISKINKSTGWSPQFSLEEGIGLTIRRKGS
ncbi:MAG: NAD-dependent epimerase/dehydratase family protein [Oscillospiraceae bacterium]|nr:NAD-dependent epimerase/dehydratase family protein [Oscillospiraceae bacterium]